MGCQSNVGGACVMCLPSVWVGFMNCLLSKVGGVYGLCLLLDVGRACELFSDVGRAYGLCLLSVKCGWGL